MLTRILLNLFVCAFLLVFLSGFRHVLRRAAPDHDWVAGLAFTAGLVYVVVTLVSNSMEAGAVFAAHGTPVDPTTDGPLAAGHTLLYGSIGRITTTLFLTASGFVALRTPLLPDWAGRTAYAVAAVNLAFVPSLYFGTDPADFYSAIGWGTTAVVASLLMYWILALSIHLLRPGSRTATVSGGTYSRSHGYASESPAGSDR
ncbi:hypothetical protein [Streptomyces sp. NBC_01142]|uniref:hypothetical protein n=1 Tax=Streptomyces sp. NBC_01142 TaxID=2975865 RepID=UPI002B1D2B0B|nr:hypothetical protein [Streptomyces sp. NBC_01142]